MWSVWCAERRMDLVRALRASRNSMACRSDSDGVVWLIAGFGHSRECSVYSCTWWNS